MAIGIGGRVISHKGITIGDNTLIAPNVQIYDHDHMFGENGVCRREFKTSEVKIGKDCWIAINNVILRGTEIGDKCVIGAGCVVKGSVESGHTLIQKRENVIKQN